MKPRLILLSAACALALSLRGAEATLSDVTSDIFGSHSQSEFAAFGQSDQRVGPIRLSGERGSTSWRSMAGR